MKKSSIACVTFLLVLLLFLSACGGIDTSYGTESETSVSVLETTSVQTTEAENEPIIDFESEEKSDIDEEHSIEFSSIVYPEKIPVIRADIKDWSFDSLKESLNVGSTHESVVIDECSHEAVADVYRAEICDNSEYLLVYTDKNQFVYETQYDGYKGLGVFFAEQNSKEAKFISVYEPFTGGKDLEFLKYDDTLEYFESVFSQIGLPEENYLVPEISYSLTADDQRTIMSRDIINESWLVDDVTGEKIEFTDDDFEELMVINWNQVFKGISVNTDPIHLTNSQSYCQKVVTSLREDGTIALDIANLFIPKCIDEEKSVIAPENIIEKVNILVGTKESDQPVDIEYVLIDLKLEYVAFEDNRDCILIPCWVAAVEESVSFDLGSSQRIDYIAFDCESGELLSIY